MRLLRWNIATTDGESANLASMDCFSRPLSLFELPMSATLKRIVIMVWVFMWLLVALAPSGAQTTRGGTDIAVVVHPDTPVSDLSLSEVRKVLLGERQYWSAKLP